MALVADYGDSSSSDSDDVGTPVQPRAVRQVPVSHHTSINSGQQNEAQIDSSSQSSKGIIHSQGSSALKAVDEYVPASKSARRAAGALFARQVARSQGQATDKSIQASVPLPTIAAPRCNVTRVGSGAEADLRPATAVAARDEGRQGSQESAVDDDEETVERRHEGDGTIEHQPPQSIGDAGSSATTHFHPYPHGYSYPPAYGYPPPLGYPSVPSQAVAHPYNYTYPYPHAMPAHAGDMGASGLPPGYTSIVPVHAGSKHGRSYAAPDPEAGRHLDKRTRMQMGLDSAGVTAPYGQQDEYGADDGSRGAGHGMMEVQAAALRGAWDPMSVIQEGQGVKKGAPPVAVRMWNSSAGESVTAIDANRTHKAKSQINYLAQKALSSSAAVELAKASSKQARGATASRYGW